MNGFGKKLNESFNTYFKKLNESNFEEFDNMTKEPVLEFPNGEYFYVDVDKENNLIFAGSATNNGIIREFEIEYDFDDTLDGNLSRLYDTIIEERPELLDEEPIIDSSINEGHFEDFIKKKVVKLFNQEINDSDIEHKIDDDGYGFTIVRSNGKTLTYDATTGKFNYNKKEDIKEDLDKYQKHPDRYNIKLSKLKDTVEDYFKTTNGDATIILNGEYYNIINESLKEDVDRSSFKSDVYNALGDVMFEYHLKGEDPTPEEVHEALEWFEIRFFEFGYDEEEEE